MDKTKQQKGFNNKGFTLIELLVTMALVGIVAAGLISSFIGQQEAHMGQEQVVAMQQNIRSGIYIMTREIRMAVYDPYNGDSNAGIINAGNGSNQANALTFSYVIDDDGKDNAEDTDGDGVLNGTDGVVGEKRELSTISFYLYDAYADNDLDLGMKIGTANVAAIAENIDDTNFTISYLDSSGNATTVINNIAAVQLNITAKVGTGEVDRTVQNSTRNVTTIIQCRNLNL
ncbi:MAG: prepilin-type N-terminal cleavage/methylation domain-containing protein [Desulfobacter sp.]|nr:prepilin-type N-terminal cleavage/methylation domain-containing protein [Desulfobacter sp.]